ncbi:MAG: amino acid ABC transporter permease [Rhodospirillum sp.]|nr:amino acid ABC transporter permease [Rhodospirillum sp.]MCF8490569.1 amino acid ABC transporter permease [Rhodospirillum sp.]MCF8502118.1 amino acid ABC transporter permease [Rhodospirillum sp.]
MWDVVSQYGMVFLVGNYPHGPLGGLAMTVTLSVCGLVATFPLAVAVALCRTGGIPWLRAGARAFVMGVRTMPLLLVVFWIYYFLPTVIGVPISAFATILLAIVVYQTAYLSEVIRAAIEALPKGQLEAARSLGLKYVPTTFRVILPQALYNCVPGMINQFITIIKETSLGYTIALQEVTYAGNEVNSILLIRPLEVFGVVAVLYFTLCFTLSRLSRGVETRISRTRGLVGE